MATSSLERRSALTFVVLAGALGGVAVVLPKLGAHKPAHDFDRVEVMIPMRDGVRLQTAIFTPHGRRPPLPLLLQRTPYNVPGEGDLDGERAKPGRLSDGYIMVSQNIRGRYKSEGTFVMQRPPHDPADAKGTDESTDAWDTIDWLVKNVPDNTGKVCIYGTSYPGWTTAMAMRDPHPALKCASERAAMGDLFINDDFHHNGAFRLSYGFEYVSSMESSKEGDDWDFDTLDTYDWYLRLGALSHVDERYFHGKLPTWENFVAHPNRDEFWGSRAPSTYLTHTTVPNLNVAGWFDQEDFLGPMQIYADLEKTDTARTDFLVVGPWNHGGWGHEPGRKLGKIDFGHDVSSDFLAHEDRQWFAHWLHDAPDPALAEATVFETGSNRWLKLDAWPPTSGTTTRRLYLRYGGKASFEAPNDSTDVSDAYVSDPANPVPYRARPIDGTYSGDGWRSWLTEDQRFVDHRPDVLTWETDPLDHDVVVRGDIVADLFASTSGTDSDWVVKLIDVLPETKDPTADAGAHDDPMRGYELMVTSEILRGRFRDSFSTPAPVPADAIVKYAVDLHSRAHAFRAGHRIMVQVQSTWFPLYDRNPQTYVDNIFRASDSDFVKATQRVFRSAAHPSSIALPVVSAH